MDNLSRQLTHSGCKSLAPAVIACTCMLFSTTQLTAAPQQSPAAAPSDPSPGVRVAGRSPSASFRPIGSPAATPQPFQRPFQSQSPAAQPQTASADHATSPQQVNGLNFRPPRLGSSGATSKTRKTSGVVQQTAYMQADGFGLPPTLDNQAAPAVTTPRAPALPAKSPAPANRQAQLDPRTNAPSTMRGQSAEAPNLQDAPSINGYGAPNTSQPLTRNQPSASDSSPVSQPQLQGRWATSGNSQLVTGPSGYSSTFWECGPPVMQASGSTYAVTPPTMMPNSQPMLAVTRGAMAPRPLVSMGQENYNVQLGRGIVGQPVAYVPGQNIRNFFRYLFP